MCEKCFRLEGRAGETGEPGQRGQRREIAHVGFELEIAQARKRLDAVQPFHAGERQEFARGQLRQFAQAAGLQRLAFQHGGADLRPADRAAKRQEIAFERQRFQLFELLQPGEIRPHRNAAGVLAPVDNGQRAQLPATRHRPVILAMAEHQIAQLRQLGQHAEIHVTAGVHLFKIR